MRSLEYRSARIQADFDVDFLDGEWMFRGTCIDVSDTGVRARFPQHIPEGTQGSLVLHHPLRRTIITVRVVYLQKDQIGFAFFQPTLGDREVLRHLMSLLRS
jgi:hypothetical protein